LIGVVRGSGGRKTSGRTWLQQPQASWTPCRPAGPWGPKLCEWPLASLRPPCRRRRLLWLVPCPLAPSGTTCSALVYIAPSARVLQAPSLVLRLARNDAPSPLVHLSRSATPPPSRCELPVAAIVHPSDTWDQAPPSLVPVLLTPWVSVQAGGSRAYGLSAPPAFHCDFNCEVQVQLNTADSMR
jgi:hypothetical protein